MVQRGHISGGRHTDAQCSAQRSLDKLSQGDGVKGQANLDSFIFFTKFVYHFIMGLTFNAFVKKVATL